MHSLLETYLSEVEATLSALPARRRVEELREMRTHLDNAVIVNRELGQSEDEAVQTAVAQFGMARDLGENVVWAWRRGKRTNRRANFLSFLGAAICVTVLETVELDLLAIPLNSLTHSDANTSHPWIVGFCAFSVMAMAMALSGWVSGFAFPRRAVVGATFAVVGQGVGLRVLTFIQYGRPARLLFLHTVVYFLIPNLILYSVTVLAAWLGGRKRQEILSGRKARV